MTPGTSTGIGDLQISTTLATPGVNVKQEAVTARVGKQTWTCNICQKQLSSKRSYTEHLNIHNKTRPFQCDHCDYAAASNMTLHRHRLRTHIPKTEWGYRCPYCDEAYMEPAGYQQHVQIHHPGKSATYGCPFRLCNLKSKSQRHFKEHLAKHDRNDKIEGGMDPTKLTGKELVRFVIKDEMGTGFVRSCVNPVQKLVIRARPLAAISPKKTIKTTTAVIPRQAPEARRARAPVHLIVQPKIPSIGRVIESPISGGGQGGGGFNGNPGNFGNSNFGQHQEGGATRIWREPKVTIRGVPVQTHPNPVVPPPNIRYFLPSSSNSNQNPYQPPRNLAPIRPRLPQHHQMHQMHQNNQYYHHPNHHQNEVHHLPRSYAEIPQEFELDTDLPEDEVEYGTNDTCYSTEGIGIGMNEAEEEEEDYVEMDEEIEEEDDEGPPVLDRQEHEKNHNDMDMEYCRQQQQQMGGHHHQQHNQWIGGEMVEEEEEEVPSGESTVEVFPNGFIEDELD